MDIVIQLLEIPLHTKARIAHEAVVTGEIEGKLDLSADVEVVTAEVLADIVPELRLGEN